VFADLDTASPQLYYVHPDHLNRPLRMTDGAEAVVWDAVYKTFGHQQFRNKQTRLRALERGRQEGP
jgi:uncharacterized protein RhaS with RHS repeats